MQLQSKKYDKHGNIITHGFFKGHLTKTTRRFRHLSWGKPNESQVDVNLTRKMQFPEPLDKREQAIAKANGLSLKNGFVVNDKD